MPHSALRIPHFELRTTHSVLATYFASIVNFKLPVSRRR